MSMFSEVVQLQFPGSDTTDYDELGNPIKSAPTVAEWPAWYEERTSSEALDAREQRVWGYWIYLPLTEDDLAAALLETGLADDNEDPYLLAEDLMLTPPEADMIITLPVDGQEYRIVGEPGRQPGGMVVQGYVHAAIERVEG